MTTADTKEQLMFDVIRIQNRMNIAARLGNWDDVGHLMTTLSNIWGQLAILDGQGLHNKSDAELAPRVAEIRRQMAGTRFDVCDNPPPSPTEGAVMHEGGAK